jgi:hypothetical protein
LPALVALDTDGFPGCGIGLGSDVFELERPRFADRLSYAVEFGNGPRARVAARLLRDVLDDGSDGSIRTASHKALVTLGWLPLPSVASA